MVFNPFEINDTDNAISLFNVDPDIQYFNDYSTTLNYGNSNYFLEDTFNKKCSNLIMSHFPSFI